MSQQTCSGGDLFLVLRPGDDDDEVVVMMMVMLMVVGLGKGLSG